MTHKLLKFSFLILVFALVSCEKDVVLDLSDQEGQFIIVDANIADSEQMQFIKLNYSSSYYAVSEGQPLLNANVRIRTDEDVFEFLSLDVDSLAGYYFNEQIYDALQENNYRLEISKSDGQEYFAESRWQNVPQIDSLHIQLNPFSELGFGDEIFYDIFVHFENTEDRDRHFLFNYYLNDTLRTLRPAQKTFLENETLTDYVSFSAFSLSELEIQEDDVITVEIRSISREQYEFYLAFFFQTDLSGNPFAGGPSANIPTNLSEGALGFFQVSATSKDSIVFKLPE